jgi:hypothetical protein
MEILRFFVATCVLVGTSVVPAQAEPEPAETEFFMNLLAKGGQEQKITEALIAKIGEGIFWANSYDETIRKQPPVYCQPEQLRVTTDQYVQIFKDYVAANPDARKKPAGYTMLFGLQRAFPCK